MRPRDTRKNHNPANMTAREIKQANNLHKKMKAALAKDRAEREEK